ncbi:MAG: hypothetical protein HYU66_12140 [Armatimonadetes bacterium]|nr:hypothetical protein [Armatimonadota bacterium]
MASEPARPHPLLMEAVAAGLVLLAGAPLLAGRIYYLDDFQGLGLPLFASLRRALHAGASPAWCPDMLAGYPALAAGQSGAAYPLNQVLFRLLPLIPAVAVFYLFHLWLLVRAMLGLLRELGATPSGAVVGAAVAGLGGAVAGHHMHANVIAGMGWTGPVLWLGALVARRPDGRLPSLLLAAALGLMLLQAHPQYSWFAILALWCTTPWWRSPEVGAKRLAGRLAFALTAGLLLAAAQLAPEAQYVLVYPREHPGGHFSYLTAMSFEPRDWLRLLQPDLFGSPLHGDWSAAGFEYWETRGFCGTGFLVLALAGFLGRRREPAVRGALCLALVALVLLPGRHNPLYHLLVHLPPFSFFRGPGRHVWLLQVAVAVAAAFGRGPATTAGPDSQPRPQERTLRLAVLAVCAAWLVAIVAYSASRHLAAFGRGPGLWLALLSLAAAGAVVRTGRALPLLLVLALVELTVAWHSFAVTQPRALFETPPPLAAPIIASDQPRLLDVRLSGPGGSLGDLRRLANASGAVWGVTYLRGEREAILPGGLLAVIRDLDAELETDPARFAFDCDRLSVRWVVTSAALSGPHWRLAGEDAGAKLYENLGGVQTGLEDPPPILPVAVESRTRGRWVLHTRFAEPVAVVLAESLYDGWIVEIDGRQDYLNSAERILMSVVVPAGEHTVTFRFDNAYVYLGASLARLAWLAWWAAVLGCVWAARRRPGGAE